MEKAHVISMQTVIDWPTFGDICLSRFFARWSYFLGDFPALPRVSKRWQSYFLKLKTTEKKINLRKAFVYEEELNKSETGITNSWILTDRTSAISASASNVTCAWGLLKSFHSRSTPVNCLLLPFPLFEKLSKSKKIIQVWAPVMQAPAAEGSNSPARSWPR